MFDERSQPDSDATGDGESQGDLDAEEDFDDRIAFAGHESENVHVHEDKAIEDLLAKHAEVNPDDFPLLRLPTSLAEKIQNTWQAFLAKYSSREAAGEAIFDAIMEEAPTLQSMFKMPRSVFALRFTMSLTNVMGICKDAHVLKKAVETLGFQHMDLEVTVPRVGVLRDAIMGQLEAELGTLDPVGQAIKAVLNYAGGAFIFVKREFGSRIRIIQRSWKIANRKDEQEDGEPQTGSQLETVEASMVQEEVEEEEVDHLELQDNQEIAAILQASGDRQTQNAKVPNTFPEMFLFNAAVMGFGESKWMKSVLAQLDDIATNVANSSRLQEECDVLSLVLAKYKGVINLPEFKAVMLASLRSVVPQDWDMEHETAWTWLWENIERMLTEMMGGPLRHEKALRNWISDLAEEMKLKWRRMVFSKLFKTAPTAQKNYLKQSTGRLHFIADRILEMTLELYMDPLTMVDQISACGLRHVGYGVPTEMFPPLVAAYTDALEEVSKNAEKKNHVQSFRWSLSLISKMLIRVITEGSTVVMKAINTNHEAALKKAVAIIPRVQRATDLLNVSCGTQSISPLYWAIDSGSLNCAKAIIEDLLTIRADRDVYYYGCDALFTRHPDLIHQMCLSAPTLLQPLLDGLVWRSRYTVDGKRRVNYYVKHLVQDLDGNFSETLSWLVEYQDPHVVSHPAAALAADLIWFRFAVYYFLRGRCYLLLTLCIFIAGQAVLGNGSEESFEENVAIFSCRCFLYFGSMCQLLYQQVKLAYVDIKRGAIDRSYVFPIPEYLFDVQQALYMTLVSALIVMFFLEPILWCIKDSAELGIEMNNATGTYIFTENCPEAQEMRAYYVFSCLAMLLYWALLVDFAVISMRLSAFVLVCSRVMSEVGLFFFALFFLIVAFATAISSLNHSLLEYDGVHLWLAALLRISLGMFPATDFLRFKDEVPVFVAISAFVAVVFVVMLNLLVAQLTESYHSMFKDSQGYARLNRAAVVVSVMGQATQKRWSRFLSKMGFEEKLEFNQGDIGLAGGIQILEPANASTVTVESIKRYGGSTAPSMPWPEEESLVEEDRFERLEKLILKRNKGRSERKQTSGIGAGLSQGSASSGGMSIAESE